MTLKVLIPTEILVDETVDKVVAQAANGQFCLLPRHIDFVAPLVAGILAYQDTQQATHYLGIDDGVLVKAGAEVLVSTRQATRGAQLDELEQRVQAEFRRLDEHEEKARAATAKLEAGLVRRFLDVQQQVAS